MLFLLVRYRSIPNGFVEPQELRPVIADVLAHEQILES